MTKTQLTDAEKMTSALAVAGGRATLSWHEGDPGHRAIRITGCYPEVASDLAMLIAREFFGEPDRNTGLWGLDTPGRGRPVAISAGFVCVWIR